MQRGGRSIAKSYRSLVLGHLYIAAKEAEVPISSLPDGMLRRLGVTPKEDSNSVTTFSVRIPRSLGDGPLRARIRRLRKEIGENARMFQRRSVRRDEDAAAKQGRADWAGCGWRKAAREFGSDPLEENAFMRMASDAAWRRGPKDNL